MKFLKGILFIALLCLNHQVAEAQFWKKLQKKVEDKIEREAEKRTEKRVNKTIDKTFDKAENTVDGKNKKNKQKKHLESKTTQNYTFNKSLEIEISLEKQKNNMVFESFLSNDNTEVSCMKMNASSMEGTEDMQGDMYILFAGEKTGIYMNMMGMKMKKSMSSMEMANYDNTDQIEKATISKTGKTKTILGYKCQEYMAKTEDATSHIWATTGNFPFQGNFVPLLGMKKSKENPIDGFVLEMTTVTKDEKIIIRVTKINEDKSFTLNTSAYKSMGF